MAKINIYESKVQYEISTKKFTLDGRKTPFGTKHTLLNEKTGMSKDFNFSHSTGSEWASDTIWIYKSLDGYELHVGNEAVTPQHAQNSLNAKLRK